MFSIVDSKKWIHPTKKPGSCKPGLKYKWTVEAHSQVFKDKKSPTVCGALVLEAGLEPARPKEHRILSPACLPIPPLEHLFWKRTVDIERETGFEPATPTLARLCSTNWATLAYFNDITFVYVMGDKFINILWFFSRERHNISHPLTIIWAYNWLFLFVYETN